MIRIALKERYDGVLAPTIFECLVDHDDMSFVKAWLDKVYTLGKNEFWETEQLKALSFEQLLKQLKEIV